MWDGEAFVGAKLALLCGADLVAYRRDRNPGIPFPGLWDLPGGGREGDESPVACVLRELGEEFGIRLAPGRLAWARRYPPLAEGRAASWFFAAAIGPEEVARIRFGDEGEAWTMMPAGLFLRRADAVPYLQARLADVLAETPPGSALGR
ncbi:NUDIX hydrolase [Methylobacterium sp. 4-46]|uniref:NUDIX hydrolase n=1 Tax=unclassified Methylobacterium TaxID=2615210 RepID=UPI000152D5E2|nr:MULTISPECIES: NUDIX hydrolase [Methylobacterium]ACA20590.1 NUDIX hydrolase [Methylobacterium sp. 4-46]WFT79754.1 NUDIX hydrolase [Methylobacterium nodulans]